nr:tetratricopeptide repeat protein [Buchnera aphidicola]
MQSNLIKKSKNFKKKIFLIIFFFILVFFMFFSIIKSKKQKKSLNQPTYEEIIEEINANTNENFFNAEKFIIDNKNVYGTLISLSLAKKYILKNHLEKAFIQLKNSLKYTTEENLKNILRLRMSKIKMQQNKNKDAIQIIEEIKDDSWSSIVENIKGDIFMNDGNKKLAIKCWEKSKFLEESQTLKKIINMKINEVQIK